MDHCQWLESYSLMQANLFSLGLEILVQWGWGLSCMHAKHQNYWNMGAKEWKQGPGHLEKSVLPIITIVRTDCNAIWLAVCATLQHNKHFFKYLLKSVQSAARLAFKGWHLAPWHMWSCPVRFQHFGLTTSLASPVLSLSSVPTFSLAGKLMTRNCEFAALGEGAESKDNPASLMVIWRSRVAFMFFSAAEASWATFSACSTRAFKLSFAFLAASNFSLRSAAFCKAVETLASNCSAYFSASRNAPHASCNFLSMLLLLPAWPWGLRVRSWSMPSSSSLWRKWLEGYKVFEWCACDSVSCFLDHFSLLGQLLQHMHKSQPYQTGARHFANMMQ